MRTRLTAKVGRTSRRSYGAAFRGTSLFDLSARNESLVKQAKRRRLRQTHKTVTGVRVGDGSLDRFGDDPACKRISATDPFFSDVKYLFIAKQSLANISSLTWHFDIDASVFEKVSRNDYNVHFGCLKADDSVQHRIHWPNLCACQANGVAVPVMRRHVNKPIGRLTRDAPVDVSKVLKNGPNIIHLEFDGGHLDPYIFYARVCMKRTVDELMNMIVSNPRSNLFDVAKENSAHHTVIDMEMSITSTVSTNCPISLKRCEIPVRSNVCNCLQVFDLKSFLLCAERCLKWNCPCCSKPTSPENLGVDDHVLSIINGSSEDNIFL